MKLEEGILLLATSAAVATAIFCAVVLVRMACMVSEFPLWL